MEKLLYDLFADTAYLPYMWLIIGLIFLFIELATPGLFFFVAFFVGCCSAALVSLFEVPFTTQFSVALIMSFVAFMVVRRWALTVDKYHDVKTNYAALVGSMGVVTKMVGPLVVGRVRVGNEEWSAVVSDDTAFQVGTHVVVTGLEGNKVIVTKIKKG